MLSRCDGVGAIHTDIGALYLETRTRIASLLACSLQLLFLLALGFLTCASAVVISFARLVQSGSSSMKWNTYGVITSLGLISGARGTSGPIGRPFLPPQPVEVM